MDNLIIITVCLSSAILIFLNLIISCLFLYFSNKNYKKISSDFEENAKDLSEALTKVMEYLNKQTADNLDLQQKLTDWEYSMFEKVIQNSSENFNFIAKQEYLTQGLISNMLESLGFRSKFDEQNIEKPKRNYGDPPPPVELEGLKITDAESIRKK